MRKIKIQFTYILVALVAALSFSLHDALNKYHAARDKSNALEATVTDMEQQIKRFEVRINDSTKAHAAQVSDLHMTIKNIEKRNGELLAAAKIKPKDVGRTESIGTVTKDTVRVPVYIDGFGGMQASYTDDYTKIDVAISQKKEAAISYAIKDSLTVINVQKKHSILFGLIKWKETEKTTVISHNPKSEVVGLEVIDVIQ